MSKAPVVIPSARIAHIARIARLGGIAALLIGAMTSSAAMTSGFRSPASAAAHTGSLPPIATVAPAAPTHPATAGPANIASTPTAANTYVVPAHAFDVTKFGAIGDGRTNSAPGIQAAIDAAQAVGGMVFLPPGHYFDATGVVLLAKRGRAVTIAGAGRDQTFLTQGPGGRDLLSVNADHSVVQDLSLDAHTYNGGSAFSTSASYVTLQRCRAVGDTVHWAVRFAGGSTARATPANPSYATGNVVNDLLLHDYAQPWNDGLDFSFQSHGSISNVNHVGSRLGLYVDSYVSVTNYTFAPEPSVGSGSYGFYITSPGDHISITNFTSSGQGGHIGEALPGTTRNNTDITILNEQLTSSAPGVRLFVGDVTNCLIENSRLQTLEVGPSVAAQVVLQNTRTTRLLRAGDPGSTTSVTYQ